MLHPSEPSVLGRSMTMCAPYFRRIHAARFQGLTPWRSASLSCRFRRLRSAQQRWLLDATSLLGDFQGRRLWDALAHHSKHHVPAHCEFVFRGD